MAYYVEIPYQIFPRLEFPSFCPFTLTPNANTTWEVVGRTKSSGFSLPGVPLLFTRGRKCIFKMPAAAEFVRQQNMLTLVIALLLVPSFIALAVNAFSHFLDNVSGYIMLIPALSVPVYLFKWIQRRHVRIDYVGQEFLEIVFKRSEYAEAFCAMNGLEYKKKWVNFRVN